MVEEKQRIIYQGRRFQIIKIIDKRGTSRYYKVVTVTKPIKKEEARRSIAQIKRHEKKRREKEREIPEKPPEAPPEARHKYIVLSLRNAEVDVWFRFPPKISDVDAIAKATAHLRGVEDVDKRLIKAAYEGLEEWTSATDGFVYKVGITYEKPIYVTVVYDGITGKQV
jgi:hypothetical protein